MKVSDLHQHELFTLPIVRSGRLVGVLSMRDVLDADTHRIDGNGSR